MTLSPSDVISASEIGQRFALNFRHCWTKEDLFEDRKAVEQFLKAWWTDCVSGGKNSDASTAFAFLVSVASKATTLWGKAAYATGQLARVVSFTAFFSPPTSARPIDHSFFRTKYVTDIYGLGLKALTAGDVFRKVERINGDRDAIRPGAQVRGQMPLSWTTSVETIADERTAYGSVPSSTLARRVCRRLGLEGRFYLNSALFQLNYPRSETRHVARRPTALEGLGNRYFRARRDGAYHHNFGYTVDLDRFEALEANVDGGVEVLVPTLPFNHEFKWQGIGILASETTPLNETEFKNCLSSDEFELSLKDAVGLIEGLCQ